MNRGHFIITGTSRGIGEQLSTMLLDNGNFVYGISRGDSNTLDKYKNYTHRNFDLSNILGIELMLKEIFNQINLNDSEMICLINNAAMLEPLKRIDNCNAEEINKNLQISLIAPMVLTSYFIRQTDNVQIRKKIINISSGSGTYPAPAMSVYCTAKAGINMFTQCIGAEQSKQQYPLEIIAVDPGMVETELQIVARGKNDQDFEMAKFFKQAHQTGQLQSTEELGKHLINIIDKKIEPGKLVNYSEG
ncbi:SDR family NAD(P)-dependent oxidoreductase [Paenibacillus brasilensis]|uniref:Benzil reductase ((S)-benzoin forming) n=1 Tax=Paenibacillus brasilensis TaxID=128574 RepID=A0ABU0L696_9BACL|nr:SDR family NAD(P)-dependent oxidoreductase [Paenibacillus brasilensis]MDQ0496792.1 benzil reductase ((S)-benzoin forming) [Paenibacillus brasilensis]